MAEAQDELVTINDAARRLGIERSALDRRARDGRLASSVIGGHRLVTMRAVRECLDQFPIDSSYRRVP